MSSDDLDGPNYGTVIVVITENRKLAELVHAIVVRLRGTPHWLAREHYRWAAAQIRRTTGDYQVLPAGVVIDTLIDTKLLNHIQLANQLTESRPPIPVVMVVPAAKEGAYKNATLAGGRTLFQIVTHGAGTQQFLMDRLQAVLYTTRPAPPEPYRKG